MNAWLCGAVSLLVATTSGPVATANGRVRSRRLAFGSGAHWILIDPVTRKAESISLPGGHKAIQLVASHDGDVLIFTEQTNAKTSLLYKWDRVAGGEPVSIGDPTGYHSDPAFSLDERWILFAHNPNSGGGPGQHAPGAYAQIFKVPVKGGPIVQLTSNPGCHFAPAEGARDEIVWVHSTCRLLQSLEAQRPTLALHSFDAGKGRFESLTADREGRIVYSAMEYRRLHVILRDSSGAERELFVAPPGADRINLKIGVGPHDIYYEYAHWVWQWDGRSSQRFTPMPEDE